METYTETKIEDLSTEHVNIVTNKMIEVEGQRIKISEERGGYANSTADRKLLHDEVQEPYLSAILAVWGGTPTVQVQKYSQ